MFHLKSVIRPGTHFQVTDLIVKREEGDVDLTAASEPDDRGPEHVAITTNHSEALHVPGCVIINATKTKTNSF